MNSCNNVTFNVASVTRRNMNFFCRSCRTDVTSSERQLMTVEMQYCVETLTGFLVPHNLAPRYLCPKCFDILGVIVEFQEVLRTASKEFIRIIERTRQRVEPVADEEAEDGADGTDSADGEEDEDGSAEESSGEDHSK